MAGNKFLTKLKLGKNLKVLNSAREWFASKGIDVVRYFFSTSNPVRNQSVLTDHDLNECEICGQDLYRIDESSRYNNFSQIRVTHKKHLVFIDNVGRRHMTCYALNRCFRRVGYDINGGNGEDIFDFTPPSVEEFASPEIDMDSLSDSVRESVRYDYNRIVTSFLESWVHTKINKDNVMKFFRDLDFVMTKFVHLYCEEVGLFRQKILNIIGVKLDA